MKKYFIFLAAGILLILSFLIFTNSAAREHFSSGVQNLAGVFFIPSITVDELLNKYHKKNWNSGDRINILIVPGHEPGYGGTVYRDLKERDIVVEIARSLKIAFKKDTRFNVMIARDKDDWDPVFQKYFVDQWEEIIKWKDENKANTIALVESGEIKDVEGVGHNNAAEASAIRLYGINKWVNENDIDIVLHLHINDMPRNDTSNPGEHTGFAIYIPEQQYSNAEASREMAKYLKESLEEVIPVSSLPKESLGIIEEQELIAIGRYNTVDATSFVIEYGYIYEPMYSTLKDQKKITDRLARATYEGVREFFKQKGI